MKNFLRESYSIENTMKRFNRYYGSFNLYGMEYSVWQEFNLALVRLPRITSEP